jgi:hypothetical protein
VVVLDIVLDCTMALMAAVVVVVVEMYFLLCPLVGLRTAGRTRRKKMGELE